VATQVDQFVEAAIEDLSARIAAPLARPRTPLQIDEWATQNGLDAIVMSYSPVGGTADALTQVKTPIISLVRPHDADAWPYASAGFFKFKAKIPKLLARYDAQMRLL
jgi:deoxyribodipyrimidine photo-lyase